MSDEHVSQKERTEQESSLCWPEMMATLDYVCCKVAEQYNLYSQGQARKPAIIETISKYTCVACIDKALRTKDYQRVDNMYSELHRFACSILVEELYDKFSKNGYSVGITTEEEIKYGKIDVFIIPSIYGLSLHSKRVEIGVEVKSGASLSLSQLFRYMIDNEHRWLVLWRIRNQQVLLFNGAESRDLIALFAKTVISRANRLLLNQELSCKHGSQHSNWVPSQDQLKETFNDFSKGLIKTLPSVVNTIFRRFEIEVNEFAGKQ